MAVEAESFGPEALILKEGEEGKRLFSLRDESGAGEEGGGEGDIGPSLLLSLSLCLSERSKRGRGRSCR